MKTIIGVAVLLAAGGSPVDTYVDHAWPKGAGGTVVAARGDHIVTCRGFGMADRAARIPATCDTAYDIMSMTKQFTAAAILKLEMQGRLRVSDRIGRHLGRVPPGKQGITIHHLLTHTAGLSDIGDDYDPVSRDQMLKRALASRLLWAPGTKFAYSNLGYSMLAAIVEKASGMGYEAFLAKHLLRPAGMTRTGYVLPRWNRRQVAVEYDRNGRSQGRPFDHPWAKDGPYWFLRGNGGILSTARDMVRWHRALRGDRVLSRRAKAKMFKPYVPIEVEGYRGFHQAYGWGVARLAGGRMAAHTGGNDWSFGLVARFLDSGVLVFWVTNQAVKPGSWNLERRPLELTLGIAKRVPRS